MPPSIVSVLTDVFCIAAVCDEYRLLSADMKHVERLL